MKANRRMKQALSLATALIILSATSCQAAVATLNLDFGNLGAYVGDAGVLSSSAGTHWNNVSITSFPPGSGIGMQFHFPALLNEFGQPFDLGPNPVYDSLPNAFGGFQNGYEMASSGAAPLNDGIHVTGEGFYGIVVRELSMTAPIDVVVYFIKEDNNPAEQINTVSINDFSGGINSVSTVGTPTGTFPGVEGRDYLRFDDVMAMPTTIGIPTMPGINIAIPFGDTANIAAIQVRGDFVSVSPEPGSLTMAGLALSGLIAARRKRR